MTIPLTTSRSVMARALAVGILVAALATAVFLFAGVKPNIQWASPGALVGGLLFGIGIVIAGGCETGWMYRVVGGQVQFLIVGIGNIVGATFLAWGWDRLNIYNTFQNGWPKINMDMREHTTLRRIIHLYGDSIRSWPGRFLVAIIFPAVLMIQLERITREPIFLSRIMGINAILEL
ncbi:YeeE/YedE thiosulfate transporter family protein [Effusibacillus consociatus]|uniref:YeeE/YedE thiosulfate transporter family protein n=1 Tax=Effusibacillus consociatus TaxID=1117041 RepID=A0ABV9Q6M5_9BACL